MPSVPNSEYCQGIQVGFEKLIFWPQSAPFFALPYILYVVCLALLKTAQQSEKGSSGCATPKENKNRISAIVDKEHFLVFCNSTLYLGHRPCQCNTTVSFHFKSTLGPTSSLWRGTYFFSRGFIISIIGFLLLSRQSSLCLLNLVSVCSDL